MMNTTHFNTLTSKISMALVSLFAFHGVAHANTAELTNSATVVRMCSIATTQHMTFPPVDLVNPQTILRAQGTVEVACTPGTYSLRATMGTNAYNSSPTSTVRCQRTMKSRDRRFSMSYYLYNDENMQYPSANHSTVSNCDDSTLTTSLDTLVFATNNPTRTMVKTIYGVIRPDLMSERLTAGGYTDSIGIIVNF